ncbi:MAG TPA: ATP-binding protein [Clostridiaceae bacterium]|nr:ATP-binding protein [Clostridiaceae bacterium]
MKIQRPHYQTKLINKRENGLIKVITGIRRSGKSYLLDPLFKDYLLAEGVPGDHIIKIEFDRIENLKFHKDVEKLNEYIRLQIKDKGMHYLLLDEIQLVEQFEFLLTGLLYEKNIDIYVTGSNSKFLSSDIITEFRGRADQVRVFPLCFSEFMSVFQGDKLAGWSEYITFGGMPLIHFIKTDEEKSAYLKDLFQHTYFKDIVERYKIQRVDILDSLVSILASSIGSLTNPKKIHDTFKSEGENELSINTIHSYLSYLEEAFIVDKANRYDVKGRRYIKTPYKYYFTDVGLRNACLNFCQQEESHIMENIIYNELMIRGYNVDVGLVEIRENGKRKQTEVDFVCNQGNKRYYIQSSLHLDSREKTRQETRSLNHIDDNFKKIIIVKDVAKHWRTETGILILSLFDFLEKWDSIDL